MTWPVTYAGCADCDASRNAHGHGCTNSSLAIFAKLLEIGRRTIWFFPKIAIFSANSKLTKKSFERSCTSCLWMGASRGIQSIVIERNGCHVQRVLRNLRKCVFLHASFSSTNWWIWRIFLAFRRFRNSPLRDSRRSKLILTVKVCSDSRLNRKAVNFLPWQSSWLELGYASLDVEKRSEMSLQMPAATTIKLIPRQFSYTVRLHGIGSKIEVF